MKAEYIKLLTESIEDARSWFEKDLSRLAYLGDFIFDFTTYDSEASEMFARKALEVCVSISENKTFEYQEDAENYKWYLIMVNMPFFEGRLEWGTSIRGAWWDVYGDKKLEISSEGLFTEEGQLLEPIEFNEAKWLEFIEAMVEFSGLEDNDKAI